VVSESNKEMILRCFINYEDFSFSNILNTMGNIVEIMYEDTVLSLKKGDTNLAREVVQRDREVNRFYLFAIRQLIEAAEYNSIRKKIGIKDTTQIFNYRLIVKNIERISDHIKKIGDSVIQTENDSIDYPPQFFGITDNIKKLYIDSLNILFKNRVDEVNININKAKELIEEVNLLKKDILTEEVAFSKKILFITILNSLERISGYLADINELIINMNIEKSNTYGNN